MTIERRKREINMHGVSSTGRTQYLKYLSGKKIGLKGAVLSKCFDCMGYYIDGRNDCGMSECALYPWMPYRKRDKESPLPP